MGVGSDRIEQIVRSLHNFSRVNEASCKTVDIHDGLESTLSIVQHRLKATDLVPAIQVVRAYGTLPSITCYPSQLNQVFLNLINNAIDAIQESPHCGDSPEIRIQTGPLDGERVRIAIANTDSTISEEAQTQIFDPFFTTKPVGVGTGLGLFASYSIVQNHGGTITVRSGPEEGTTFEITLPYDCGDSDGQSLANAQ